MSAELISRFKKPQIFRANPFFITTEKGEGFPCRMNRWGLQALLKKFSWMNKT
jgi:hypothetical protein